MRESNGYCVLYISYSVVCDEGGYSGMNFINVQGYMDYVKYFRLHEMSV